MSSCQNKSLPNINNIDVNIDEENDIRLSNRIQNLNINDYHSNNYNRKKKQNNILSTEINTELTGENNRDNNDKEDDNNFEDIAYNAANAEEVFKLQKKKIEKMKEKYKIKVHNHSKITNYKTVKNNLKSKQVKSNKINQQNFANLSLNDNNNIFETAVFEYNLKNKNKNNSIPSLDIPWKHDDKFINEFKKNGSIELKSLAVRTTNEIDYSTSCVDLNLNFSLIGDSEFWIFTRCFVNKDTNDSSYFDEQSINNEPNVIYNKYTSLIKIIKEKNSNKCFVTFGTFYEDLEDPGKIKYETFLKRQLVDYSQNEQNKNNNYYYLENDLAEFQVCILDSGNDLIDAKILLNQNTKFNHIMGKFYLPTKKKAKLLFCGVGPSVKLTKLEINYFEKNETEDDQRFETIFSNEKKSCTCCLIF